MPTRQEALDFIKDSRLPDLVPDVVADVETFRRLNLKSDDQSRTETLRVVALLVEVFARLPPDTPFPVRES